MKRKNYLSVATIFASLLLVLGACGPKAPSPEPDPGPGPQPAGDFVIPFHNVDSRIYLSTSATEVLKGNSYTLSPVVINTNVKNVKYQIEDSSILEVNNSIINTKKAGSSRLRAFNDLNNDDKLDDNEPFAVMAVSVKEGSSDVSLVIDDKDVTLKVGDSKKLTYHVDGATPSGLDYGFYSDNEEVCTVSAGNVKAHKAGKANISITWQGYRDTIEITVQDLTDGTGLRASYVDVSETNIVMNKGTTKTITISPMPQGTIDTITTVSTNNPEVATCEDGRTVTAYKAGSAILTAITSNGKTKRFMVTVKDDSQTYDSCYSNYYGDLSWTNGADLKQKLHNIISKNVTPLKYAGNTSKETNWESNQFADQDLYDHGYVDVVYNSQDLLKTDTDSGWQREHAFAATLMTGFSTGQAVKQLGRSTDFHNLFAASAGANGSRGNKNFGFANVDNADIGYKDECAYVRKAFEPGDEDKGRLARAVFYMGVMYNTDETVDVPESWTYRDEDKQSHEGNSKTLHINSKEKAISIVEDNVDYNRISLSEFMSPAKDENTALVNYYREVIKQENPTLKDSDYDSFRQKAYESYLNNAMPYSIGHLSELLMWNSYKVDYVEMQHNNSVHTHNSTLGKGTQGNRNPFVDYPQLVDYVYGDLQDQPGSIDKLIPSYKALEMDQNNIHHYACDSSNMPTFSVGEKPTVETLGIKAIKNDLSEGTIDYSKLSVEDYTFVDDDVVNGKTITVTTDRNILEVKVNVTGGSVITFDSCTWNYSAPGSGASSAYSGSAGSYVGSLNGLEFDVTSQNTEISLSNRNADMACRFGTTTKYCETLSFVTKNAINFSGKTKVNAVFFNIACGSSKTFNYSIKVGNEEIASGTCSGSFTEYRVVLADDKAVEGKVSIIFTNVKSYIDVKGFAINAIA